MSSQSHTTRRRPLLSLSTIAIATLAVMLAASALQSTGRPAVIAAIDLERLFNSLDEQRAADASLQAMADAMNADVDRLRAAVDELRAELESFAVGTASHRELSGRIELAVLDLRSIVEFNRQKIEARRADFIRGLYMRIRESVAEISKRDGLDVVFLDDTVPALDRGDPNMVLQQISARRMIFCNSTLDITDEVITAMNASTAARNTAP